MTAYDPDWTPEEEYRILRNTLDRFMAGEASATRLYDWLTRTYAVPPKTPPTHAAQRLFRMVIVDVSVFLQ